MTTIRIKPHHFMDIIKLYGSGITEFVPDTKMQHDFYKVANQIIQNPETKLELTIYGDDICKPCIKYNKECLDPLMHIPGFTSKNTYNKTLDTRIIQLYHLEDKPYSALELCSVFLNDKDRIFEVWKEEDDSVTQKRYTLFVEGAHKFLHQST